MTPPFAFFRRQLAPLVFLCAGAACATTTSFDKALQARRWSDAAVAFEADTSLRNNETALFNAAMLYSLPGRDVYNPERARALFRQLLDRYPGTRYSAPAINQLTLLYEIQRLQMTSEARERDLNALIVRLAADTTTLRLRIDSVATRLIAEQDQTALLRKLSNRLENDLRDRENQLRLLNAELAQLKEIDLKSSRRPSADTSNRTRRVPIH